MADDIPHDGAPPGMEMDLEFKPLPLSIRPFDLTMYHPEVHGVCVRCTGGPPATRAGVTFIPWPFRGDSHAFHGYGTTSAREWYMELPDTVRHIVDEAGFCAFCMGLLCLIASRPLLGILVERWWDTTDSLHFSTAGEMTMTPFDFSMLIGIAVGGHPIPYDTDMDLPAGDSLTHLPIRDGAIYMCAGGLVTRPILRLGRCRLGHTIRLWVYAYFSRLAPKPKVEIPPMVPYSHKYDGRYQRMPRESFSFFRRFFDTVTAVEP
ncbi:hypothetical protein CsSME_00031220 [Camellia sinensis var. sinensis]